MGMFCMHNAPTMYSIMGVPSHEAWSINCSCAIAFWSFLDFRPFYLYILSNGYLWFLVSISLEFYYISRCRNPWLVNNITFKMAIQAFWYFIGLDHALSRVVRRQWDSFICVIRHICDVPGGIQHRFCIQYIIYCVQLIIKKLCLQLFFILIHHIPMNTT